MLEKIDKDIEKEKVKDKDRDKVKDKDRGKCKRIGISGGTFDPIHNGHLVVAQEVMERFDLDKILFIPVGIPPHKLEKKVTCAEHRYNMVLDAISTNPFFEASRIEIDRHGYTYTIDTLRYIKSLFGEDCKLYFIIGADIVSELVTWKQYEAVFKLCEFVAVNRLGTDEKEFYKEIDYLKNKYSAIFHSIKLPLFEISSTDIRERVKSHRAIKYFVPEKVEKYIYKNKLYLDKLGV